MIYFFYNYFINFLFLKRLIKYLGFRQQLGRFRLRSCWCSRWPHSSVCCSHVVVFIRRARATEQARLTTKQIDALVWNSEWKSLCSISSLFFRIFQIVSTILCILIRSIRNRTRWLIMFSPRWEPRVVLFDQMLCIV